MSRSLHKAVFLDRDGVLNKKLPQDCYVRSPSEFELLPGVGEALSVLRKIGFILVLVTNQRGIARGRMTVHDLENVHEFMIGELAKENVSLDAIYFCPHDEDEKCECRKPKAGMFCLAKRDLGIDLSGSYTVGDSTSDIIAGQTAGTRTIRISSGHDSNAELTFPSLLDFALHLRRETTGH